MNVQNNHSGIGESFDLKKFLAKIFDHWKLYLGSVLVFLSGAWLYVHYSTPLYNANAQILVQNDKKSNSSSFLPSSVEGGFGDALSIRNNIADQLAILQAPDIYRRIVPALNLNVSYFHKGTVRVVELYNGAPFYIHCLSSPDSTSTQTYELKAAGKDSIIISNEKEILKKTRFGDTINLGGRKLQFMLKDSSIGTETYIFSVAPTSAVAGAIMSSVSVSKLDKESNVINLNCISDVPSKAEDILQMLIAKYIERGINEKNRISDSLIAFIDGRINLVANDLNNIEARIQGFKVENKLTDIQAQSAALINNTSDYYSRLNEADVQLNIMNTMLEAIKPDSKRPVPALLTTDAGFVFLTEQYNQLIVQREKLLLSTTEGNPLIKNIDGQMAGLKRDIIRSLENQKQALQINRNKIAGANSQIGNMVSNVPVQERKYIDLSRERDVKQTLYLFLLQKKEETEISKASTLSGASIIKEARSSGAPFFPNPGNAYAVGLALGLLVPFSFLSLKALLNSKISSVEDITNHTEVNIIAEIGHSEKEGLLSLNKEGRTALAEQFRVFRTNMDFLTAGQNCSKILITSHMSGEGKSFLASNLANIYSYSGKRVLLVEMDLRKPKISQMLGLANDQGFSNYIITEKPIDHYIKTVPGAENLFLLSAGPIPPNPAELLMTKKVPTMFDELSAKFDIIIIDTPPIGIVADAQIIGVHANVSLYVIRPEYSNKDSIKILNGITENKKLPSLYSIVNDIKAGNTYKYGYKYDYGYYTVGD